MSAEEEKVHDLGELLAEKVRDWVRRASARVANETDYAKIQIMIHSPGWDDDGELLLDAKIEEKCTTDDLVGRVPGVVDLRNAGTGR